MLASHIVEVDGIFVGSLILDRSNERRRFYAVHDSVRSFHNRLLDQSGDLHRQILYQFRRARAVEALASS